jgi:hypothetical protein
MGLTVTTTLYTSAGSSTEAYINIESVELKRDRGLSVKLNNYLDRASRDLDPSSTIVCNKLYARVFIPIESGSPEFGELTTTAIHAFAYTKVKNKLITDGLSVVDDL